MAVKEIERIAMPDADTFFKNYVFTRKPVIITNLFDNEPIRKIDTAERAMDAFGNVLLTIQSEYTSQAGRALGPETMTYADYWKLVAANPTTERMCTEYEIPARVMTTFTLPTVCSARDCESKEILDLPRRYGDHDLLTNVFVGNRGNKAHIHYDGDQRQVFLYQVFGRKQVILFEPEDGTHLRPQDSNPPFGSCYLENMSEEEKRAFVDAGNGYLATIYPGETIYMPMLIWHYLEYTDDAMSFNIRFGRNRYGRFMCVDNFHRDYYLQNFAALLGDDARCEATYQNAIDRIIAGYVQPTATLVDKVRTMRALFRELCQQVCPSARVEEYCSDDREPAELEKIMRETASTLRYAHPEAIGKARPSGPLSPAQRHHIESSAARNGYSADILAHLLSNRLAKTEVGALTKAEAAQFMTYLRAPGAAW